MKLLKSVFVILSLVSKAQAAEDEHTDEHKCACEAEEFGFEIDCDNTDAMLEAMTKLQTLGCSADCPPDSECAIQFLIVQSHHDYCPEANIPEVVEDGFHDYDEVCAHCAIARKSISGVNLCPAVTCDNSGNDAYAAAINAGCENDCSSQECIDYFQTLNTVHDTCAHDVSNMC